MLKQIAITGVMGLALVIAMPAAQNGGHAQAQSAVCEQLRPLLQQREVLMKRVNGLGRKRVDPAMACSLFSSLATNGTQTIAFATENKDWCQIPDEFVANLNTAQSQVVDVRGKACTAAKQRVALEAKARQLQRQRQAQQSENNGSFGGVDGFSSGAWRVPQGAL